MPSAIGAVHTVQGDDAAGAGEDAHGADILLAERVLDAGDDGAEGRGLQRRVGRVGKGVARVEGGVQVSHGWKGA